MLCGSSAGVRDMLQRAESLRFAVSFLERSQRDDEPPLAIDAEPVREYNGLLIAPYNSGPVPRLT